jgi:hypothetical protein
MIRSVIAALAAAGLVAPSHAAEPGAADRAWIATCVKQLEREPAPRADTRLRYCTCMHEQFDDNRQVTQSEMERLYPPLHLGCNRESGWKLSRDED